MNTTVRGIPEDTYERLRRQAEREHRSLNAQILHLIEQGTTDTEEPSQ